MPNTGDKTMPTDNKPRELTTDEVRMEFLAHIRHMTEYWHELPNKTNLERMEGLAFSILTCLDGETHLPGFIVAPEPHESDRGFHYDRGENWFPENTETQVNCDIGGSLHEYYCMMDQKDES